MESENLSDSLITKRVIAQSLKDIMRETSFDKITIADIMSGCDLNRQTFYYHFHDKYELLNWIFYHEVILNFSNELTIDNWQIKLQQLLEALEKDQHFYQHALKTNEQNEFENYLLQVTISILMEIINGISSSIDENEKKFISEFFAYGCVGIIIDWAKNGMKMSSQHMASQIENLIIDCRSLAVRRYFEENNPQ
jgi:probable dihydroxyacetone kinase regulator